MFEADRVHLNVLTPDLGEGEDELELSYEGESLEIGFNAAYLLEVLRYMDTDEVKLTFKAPERATIISEGVSPLATRVQSVGNGSSYGRRNRHDPHVARKRE